MLNRLDDEAVALRIIALRKEREMTQQAFADCLLVKVDVVKQWETKGNVPARATLDRLVGLFDVTADWIQLGRPRGIDPARIAAFERIGTAVAAERERKRRRAG